MVSADEVIIRWLEDIKMCSDTDILLPINRYLIFTKDNILDRKNIDGFLDTELNSIYSNLIEFFYTDCMFLEDLMYKYLEEYTQFFINVPELLNKKEIFNNISKEIYLKTIELKSKIGNKYYELIDVTIDGSVIYFRFSSIIE